MSEGKQTITFEKRFWQKIEGYSGKIIHVVMIATKPDIIKQAPLISELRRQKEFVLTCHTGQHRDWNLSGGMLKEEFNISPDFNLSIDGSVYEKIAQIVERLGSVLEKMKKMGKTVICYPHGDTTTAAASSIASYSNGFATAHIEAGLRTLTPDKKIFSEIIKKYDALKYYKALTDRKNWSKGSLEPYPEQFNTRTTGTTAGLHFAPTPLDSSHLADEGFPKDRIFVVGNTVSDASDMVIKASRKSKIFEKYPILEKGFVRFCVHRRENLVSYHRFITIFEAMEKMIKNGTNVLLISLGGTEAAIKGYGLKKRIEKLAEKYSNFVYSPVWPFYTDVVAAMQKAKVIATDSGSMQEEANIWSVPCVTLRFNSDRPESIIAGANLLAPPVDSDLTVKIIESAWGNKKMANIPNLYGKNVSSKIVGIVKKVSERESIFRWEQERLGFSKNKNWQKRDTIIW